MSRLRANQITNENANGAPNFPHGLTVTGIVTASSLNSTATQIVAGAAVTANSGGVDTIGIVTASSYRGDGSQLTGIDASALSFGGSVKVQANASGAVVTGIITGDGSGLTGLPSGSEFNFGSTGITTTKNLGVNTTTVDNYETVGAANSFRGIYIGDGSLIFNARLDNPNGYYIGTGRNALNAGPITLGSTMTLDGAWVIV